MAELEETMNEAEQVEQVLTVWERQSHQPGGAAGLGWTELAELAVRALNASGECGDRHPQRLSIVCHNPAGHEHTWHHDDRYRVGWGDGQTVHYDLGQIELVPDPTDEEMTEPTELGVHWRSLGDDCPACTQHTPCPCELVQGPTNGTLHCPRCDGLFMDREAPHSAAEDTTTPELARAVLTALLRARHALAAVDGKYRSHSKSINAGLVRQVRDAVTTADEALSWMIEATSKDHVA